MSPPLPLTQTLTAEKTGGQRFEEVRPGEIVLAESRRPLGRFSLAPADDCMQPMDVTKRPCEK